MPRARFQPIAPSLEQQAAAWIAQHPEEAIALAQRVIAARKPTMPAISHAELVMRSFDALDRKGHNQVSIADLHDHTYLPLWCLHQTIMHLWKIGTLTVAAIEGRNGTNQRELNAALCHNGEVLGYVMRRV